MPLFALISNVVIKVSKKFSNNCSKENPAVLP